MFPVHLKKVTLNNLGRPHTSALTDIIQNKQEETSQHLPLAAPSSPALTNKEKGIILSLQL